MLVILVVPGLGFRVRAPIGLSTILYTGLVSSLVGFGFWAYLVQHYSPNQVAPFSLLVPIFGMGFSAWLLGDRLTPLETLGAALVFCGLVLTVLIPRTATPKPQ